MAILHVKTPNGVTKAYDLDKIGGIPVGFEYFSMNPNIPDGSLPLLGGTYSRSAYPDLWAWVQAQSGYCKTESEWQTLSAANNGNVPFYSSGNGSTTFRVPSLKCWVKGANGNITEVGSYLEAGLPEIQAYFKSYGRSDGQYPDLLTEVNGAMHTIEHSYDDRAFMLTSSYGSSAGYTFSANAYNNIYGSSETVQPESIIGIWLVKAYGSVTDSGSIDVRDYIDEQINRKAVGTAELLNTGTDTTNRVWSAKIISDFVESKCTPGSSIAANGYVKLDSGLIIQWGQDTEPGSNNPSKNITFPIKFTSVFTALTCNSYSYGNGDPDYYGAGVSSLTVSGFTYNSGTYGGKIIYWIALGD